MKHSKILSLCITVLAFCGEVRAQYTPYAAFSAHPDLNALTSQILAAQLKHAAKCTGIQERLIGESTYDGSGGITDSSRLLYSGTHGSQLDNFNSFTYLWRLYSPLNAVWNAWQGIYQSTLYVKYDTGYYYHYDAPGNMDYYLRNTLIYGSDDNPSEYYAAKYIPATLNSQERQLMTYNANGALMAVDLATDTSSTLSGLYETHYFGNVSYNGTLRAEDSLSDPGEPDHRNLYQYDLSGNLVSMTTSYWNSGWINSTAINYSYDGNNRLCTALYQNYNSGILVPAFCDTFGYFSNTSLPVYKSIYTYNTGTGAWQPSYRMNTSLNSSQTGWDTVRYYIANSSGTNFQPSRLEVYTYTTKNHIQKLREWDYNLSTGSFSVNGNTSHYYYEDYDDLSVPGATLLAVTNARLFPNPAGKTIIIGFGDNRSGAATLSIYNSLGQMLLQQQENLTDGSMHVDVAALPPGSYTASITAGRQTAQAKFVKQ